MKKNTLLSLLTIATISFVSCRKSSMSTPNYSVPTTYDFTNVNDSDQVKLLLMADQIVAATNLGNAVGVVVNAQQLKDMFNNVNGYFNDSAYHLNTSGISLATFSPASAKADLFNYFDSIGVYSQSIVVGDSGIAGVRISGVTNKKLLLSPNGIFYSQVVKKTLMGILSYEIANVYLTDSINNSIDNSTVIPGYGTAMEHNWDKAFGLFGVPIDFPTNVKGLKYLASYSNQVDLGLHSNATIMDAYLKGRAAISNKDMATKQTQAGIIISTLDALDAAAILQEMKEANTDIEQNDVIGVYGALSEATGFVRNLKYNTSATRKISDAQIAELQAMFDSNNPANPNLYAFVGVNAGLTTAQIEAKTTAIATFVAQIYGFDTAALNTY